MSPSLRDMLDAMYDARVPEAWRKVRDVTFLHRRVRNDLALIVVCRLIHAKRYLVSREAIC